jgi:protein-S-isoprenylcysteine O-methyltransferase Ste14
MTHVRATRGAGPKWGLASAVYFIAAMGAHALWYPRSEIRQVPHVALAVAGGALVVVGIAIYLGAAMAIRKGLKEGRLVTSGLYSLVRHPLYASHMLFVVPGIALLLRSWLLLPMPLYMYIAFRILIPAEDRDLRDRFGQEFEQYRQRTNAVFPKLRRG